MNPASHHYGSVTLRDHLTDDMQSFAGLFGGKKKKKRKLSVVEQEIVDTKKSINTIKTERSEAVKTAASRKHTTTMLVVGGGLTLALIFGLYLMQRRKSK